MIISENQRNQRFYFNEGIRTHVNADASPNPKL